MENLDNFTYKLLKQYAKYGPISADSLSRMLNLNALDVTHASVRLCEAELLQKTLTPLELNDPHITMTSNLQITLEGKAALEMTKRSHRQHTFNEFRAWATLAIAVISLVLSLINTFAIFG